MKKTILATLLLLPAVSYGHSIDECRDRQALTEMAMQVRDSLSGGESEDSLLAWAASVEGPGMQSAAYKAIDAYTFHQRPGSVSQVVFVMEYACKKTYKR
ncbi:hypothetical protein [Halomonas halocynthiae]|uniref:hypothetical protein n=1 Tax=Halomonas halocynthiae TaxID=176290 RepID=UPI000480F1A8|nr:hypothetical protein [Halomonas halocynthiae]